jgi:ankyrin repeat protein
MHCSSGQDVSSRSQLAAACRDKEFDEARHLLAAGADPRGSTCGFFNWTALHFCCQHGELGFTKELIEIYGISAEAEDKEGRTPLHIACQFGHVSISRYLISKCRCDPDYLDFEEQSPLHHAVGWLSECSESNAMEVAKFLISFAKCNPHHRDINGKNALLHACEKGFLTIVQYLINSCGASTAEVDSYGNSCLHLAASYANNLQMVKYLMNLTPGQVCSPKGNTVLHAACAANSDLDIIRYLLATGKYDPNSRNEKHELPLDLTTKPEIRRLLYMHGATPDNVVEKHGAVCGDSVDCGKPILKVLVFGNSSSGKSTLIKAVQREGSPFVFSFSQQRTAKSDEQTQGLQVVDFHNKAGHFTFYDFGGGEAYRCSYSALLHHTLYHSTAAVILMVNLCDSSDELRRQLFTWLSLVNENCTTVKGQLRVIVLGSHSDVLKGLKGDLSKIWKDLNVDQHFSQYSKLELVDSIALDCQRSESPQMTKLREHLSSSYQSLCSPEPIHFNAQCLHSIFENRFIGLLAISVQDLCCQVSLSEDCNVSASRIEYFIPCNEQVLSDLCIYMNDVGLAMYLHRDSTDRSLIILNRQILFNILATLFTPVQSGYPCASNDGIICSSLLIPQKCDINEAANALVQLEVCQVLPVDCVMEKKSSSSDEPYDNQYLYFPSLAVTSIPKSVWVFDSRFKYHFGWTLRFGVQVSSRFTEVLLIRISSAFFQISQKFNENVHFASWKNGISGLSGNECEFIAEVDNGATCILIIMRSLTSTLVYLKLRSQLIRVCYNVVHELCSGVVTEELFIDPFEAMQYPLKPSSYIAYFTFTEVIKAVKGADVSVQSTTGDTLRIKDLIGHDPYIDLGPELLHCIFESEEDNSVITDDHLRQLALAMDANDYLTKLILLEEGNSSETYKMLLGWCDRAKRTYHSLWKVLNLATVLSSTSRALVQ